MISLDYLIFYCSYLCVIILVYGSVLLFLENLKEKVWEYNKKEIINILDLYCKKAKVFSVDQKVEIFSYKDFNYSNKCGVFHIKKGKYDYIIPPTI